MMPRTARPTLQSLNADVVAEWLDGKGIEDGVPFLISPEGRYDIDLNSYFLLHPAPENTQAAIAYDLASFLTFLWHHRQPLGKRSWRGATPEDRAAYHRWRRIDERGPGVNGSTWGRELLFRSSHTLRHTQAIQPSFLGALEWRVQFRKAVLGGDRLRNRPTITSKRLTSKGDRGVVTSQHELVNQDGESVVVIEIVSLQLSRPT